MANAQMQIGEVADLTGLSIPTIRHYDQAGLVTPSFRSPGGFRLYTNEDIDRLLVIRRMKPLGFTLEEMAELLEASDRLHGEKAPTASELADIEAVFERFAVAAERRREKLLRECDYAEEFIGQMRRSALPAPY